jgi:hypothetical protein
MAARRNRTMIQIDIEKFEEFMLDYLEQAARQGETLLVCDIDGEPIAEVKPLPGLLKPKPPPQLGSAQGLIEIRPDCFDPLPDDVLDGFEASARADHFGRWPPPAPTSR